MPTIAQFAPHDAANLMTIVSPLDPDIKISYKVPKGACTTAFSTQKQYSGWVTVPGEFPTNLFFWFVEGREPTPALTIWLNGGPGSSSMFGFFTETGPCEIVEKGAGRLETAAREWGWDRASNMLFIDQPNQVGFSYDFPTNGSVDLASGNMTTPPQILPEGRNPATFLNGTFASLNPNNTANNSKVAGLAVWHLLQAFLESFPKYNPPKGNQLGVNLFAESYGGKYGPIFAETWEDQNLKHRNGSLSNSTLEINLVSLGIVNGCIDDDVQGPSYVSYALNNSYGIQLMSPVRARLANGTFYGRGGCRDLITQCREASSSSSSSSFNNTSPSDPAAIDALCSRASTICSSLLDPYISTSRSVYDISHILPTFFPPYHYLTYLNTLPVQLALGTPINHTGTSPAVYSAFLSTGDPVRTSLIPKLSALLLRGVRIGLIYGDRDYICNHLGGEAISFALASSAGAPYSTAFPSAGYAPIITNASHIGGLVRQYGNLSFSRIYQAGHFVPAYQPETAFQVFARIITGTSVSSGEVIDLGAYNSSGPATAGVSLSLPPSPAVTCFVRAMGDTCSEEAVGSLLRGEGVIVNDVWYAKERDWPGGTKTAAGTGASSTPTISPTLTGLFTATATPKDDAALGLAVDRRILMVGLLCTLGFV